MNGRDSSNGFIWIRIWEVKKDNKKYDKKIIIIQTFLKKMKEFKLERYIRMKMFSQNYKHFLSITM